MADIVINLCGDFVSTEPNIIKMSSELASLLRGGDINVVNFEAPLDGIGDQTLRSGPKLCQPKESFFFLRDNGFNLYQLANNHAVDFGEEACIGTKHQLSETVGAGTEEDAYTPYIKEINGIRIGFLSFTHHEFGVFDDGGGKQKYGTAWICGSKVYNAIVTTKTNVDYLIVLPHAGVEQVDVPLPEWRSLYRSFIDLGVDAIIGTHPHVPQGWELYNNKPIFYSLGNFYFDAIMPKDEWWYKGLMIALTVNKDSIHFKVNNTIFHKGYIDIDKTPLATQHNEYLCELLEEPLYTNAVNKMVLEKWEELKVYYVRGLGSISFRLSPLEFLKSIYCSLFRKPAASLFINALQCESHRYVALRAQKLLNE